MLKYVSILILSHMHAGRQTFLSSASAGVGMVRFSNFVKKRVWKFMPQIGAA